MSEFEPNAQGVPDVSSAVPAGAPAYAGSAPAPAAPAAPVPAAAFAAPGSAAWSSGGPSGPMQASPVAVPSGAHGGPLSSERAGRGRLAWSAVVLASVGLLGGIVFGWTLPAAIAGVVLGAVALRRPDEHRGNAIAAIIAGSLGTVLSLGWLSYSVLRATNG